MNVLCYVGEIRMFAGKKPPEGWVLCDGSTYRPYDPNFERLFYAIGTYYGGDGTSSFQVPNLCGRAPLSYGPGPTALNLSLGQQAGAETVAVTSANLPAHNHAVNATTAPVAANSPSGNFLATFPTTTNGYAVRKDTTTVNMSTQSVANTGGTAKVPVMQKYQVVSFIIATDGIFPPPTH